MSRILEDLKQYRGNLAKTGHAPDGRLLADWIRSREYFLETVELPAIARAIVSHLDIGATGGIAPSAVVTDAFSLLLRGLSARIICDAWAGVGVIVSIAQSETGAPKAYAFSPNDSEAALGRAFVKNAEWRVGDPLQLLRDLPTEIDVVASVLPFGMHVPKDSPSRDSSTTKLRNLDQLLIAAIVDKLSNEGVAFVVVAGSFFPLSGDVLDAFELTRVCIEAAFSIPPGAFAPRTNIATYLLVISKGTTERLFIAELSNGSTNDDVIDNFKRSRQGATANQGRLVEAKSFRGMAAMRLEERLIEAGQEFGGNPLQLKDLAVTFTLGRPGEDFRFPSHDNAIFIPMIGISDVAFSENELSLKSHNYAQVVIDPSKSKAKFVALFLNSDLGREIRETMKGGVIPKLNSQTLKGLTIFVPDLEMQSTMLQVEGRITAEENVVLGIHNEIAQLRRSLWTNSGTVNDVAARLSILSAQMSGELTRTVEATLDRWFEALPFPLASIVRAWQATEAQDYKTKHEHLLSFFEATAEFVGVIFLSAFASTETLFSSHREYFVKSLDAHHLSLERATFGTWKFIAEFFGKQTRQLLSNDTQSRSLAREIFADESLQLPAVLARKELAAIFATTNKMRNDWKHGGVVGNDEARLRNEQLLGEVQKLREAMGDIWADSHLLHALSCRPRRGVFETDVALLMGSNSEFLRETRAMTTCLDVERLYLSRNGSNKALKLLPLIKVGPVPKSHLSACYFFNRLEREGARFVSYHFVAKPDFLDDSDAADTIRLLTQA